MEDALHDWSEVVAFFEGLCHDHPQFAPLFNLAKLIAHSGYAHDLWPWTSMHELCVSQRSSERRHLDPHLRIRLNGQGAVEFRYVDTADTKRQWSREERPEQAFARFESFCAQLNWFGGLRRGAAS